MLRYLHLAYSWQQSSLHVMRCSRSAGLTLPEVLFTGWSGLRGSVSLIILADFINKR